MASGTPASADVRVSVPAITCPAPSTTLPPVHGCTEGLFFSSDEIVVGEAPSPVRVDPPATVTLVSGELPPGLTLNSDGTWTGAADQAGTFGAQLRVGAADSPCSDSLSPRVVVRAAPLARTGIDASALVAIALGMIAGGVALKRRSAASIFGTDSE
jgi:hypothetical protein